MLPMLIPVDDTNSTTFRQPAPITIQMQTIFSSVEWLADLPQILEQRGLVRVKGFHCPVNKILLKHETDVMVSVITELKIAFQRMMEKNVSDTFNEAAEEMFRDVKSGRMFSFPCMVAIGQKPI